MPSPQRGAVRVLAAPLVCLLGCTSPATPTAAPAQPAATPWPEADALFRRDPRWLGGDAVYSVELGHERILWLFGDSFVARGERGDHGGHPDRHHAAMVRNSLAVQQGLAPARASITFHWGTGPDGAPASFFPEVDGLVHWPLHGLRLAEGPLLLFQSRIRNTPGQGLGFAGAGWRLVRVDDPDGAPPQWHWRELAAPPTPNIDAVGTAVWRDGEHVMALATAGNGPHRGFLCRFAVAELLAGRVAPEFWNGHGFGGTPAVVLDDAAPECSLHRTRTGWLHVASRGFGASVVAAREAGAPTGPWSPPRELFTPPESRGVRPFVYAGKAHPEVDAGPGWLAVSYAANAFEFGDLFTERGQEELYWPRFWRVPVR